MPEIGAAATDPAISFEQPLKPCSQGEGLPAGTAADCGLRFASKVIRFAALPGVTPLRYVPTGVYPPMSSMPLGT